MFSDPASNISRLGVNDGMKVVDLGAGSGFYSLELAKRVGPTGRVFSIDVQKDLLERLKSMANVQGLKNIEVVWANAEKIGGTKLHDYIADRIVCSNILFQIEKHEDFALEIKRLLKPGGKLLVVDWTEASAMSPHAVFSATQAKALFEKNRFTVEQTFDAGDHHYGIVFTK